MYLKKGQRTLAETRIYERFPFESVSWILRKKKRKQELFYKKLEKF